MKRIAACATATLLLAAVPSQAQEKPHSSGTGFFVNAQGWALTNAHVLEGCTRVGVAGMGDAKSWLVDAQNDLAAVQVAPAEGRAHLALRQDRVRLGDDIAALGFPLHGVLSDSIKITTGNINSLVGIDNDTRYLQVSTPLQPGNSGGPVVDRSGRVVGIATAVLGTTFAANTGILPQNVNFAVRSNVAELFLQSRGIDYEITASGELLGTADLAEMVSPAVVQVLCFKQEEAPTAAAAASPPVPEVSAVSPTAPIVPGDPRTVAAAFAYAYHAAWSSPNEEALSFMDGVYQGTVNFYGGDVTRSAVLAEKRKFAERWPVRDYSIREATLQIGCDGAICSVSATVDWFAHSPQRRKSADGVAKFDFRLDTLRLAIERESGSNVKGQSASPVGMLERWHEQNGTCRGSSGDGPETWKACEAREFTQQSLIAAGLCYGKEGEYGYQMEWHACGRGSIR